MRSLADSPSRDAIDVACCFPQLVHGPKTDRRPHPHLRCGEPVTGTAVAPGDFCKSTALAILIVLRPCKSLWQLTIAAGFLCSFYVGQAYNWPKYQRIFAPRYRPSSDSDASVDCASYLTTEPYRFIWGGI
jgi:hypothetical protein